MSITCRQISISIFFYLQRNNPKPQKKNFQALLQKPTKKTQRTNKMFRQHGVLSGFHFQVFFYLFALSSDPSLPSPPKRSPDPKKVTKWLPKSYKFAEKNNKPKSTNTYVFTFPSINLQVSRRGPAAPGCSP